VALALLAGRPDREIVAALFSAPFALDFPFVVNVMCAESRLRAALATIAKMRFLLDFETPRWEAKLVADFTGNEIVRAFDMNA
jgi:hypothetical protein